MFMYTNEPTYFRSSSCFTPKLLKSLTATRNDSSAHPHASISTATVGDGRRRRCNVPENPSPDLNFAHSSESETPTRTCNSWILMEK